jgi:RNA ligase
MMTYDFPYITHINDVLPHIEGRKEFRVIEKEGYTVIKYMVVLEDTFQWDDNDPVGSAIRRECRGITFNENGDLICRKYQKFFNVGEKEETQVNKINLYEPHIVLEKLDGSLISTQPTPYGFRLCTKSGITSVAMNAEVFVADKPHYATFINKCIQRKISPLFEWCSRKNRVVVDYPEDQLILTGMRYNDTGLYVTYDTMKDYATSWNIPVVNAVNGLAVQDINLFVKQVREWDDGEGVVIRFDSGHMCKVKSADYVLRHKSKESISQEKNVLDCILQDAVDDLIPLLTPEDAERLQRFQKAFLAGLEDVCTDIHDLYRQIDKGQDQKEYAIIAVASVLPEYQPFMYRLRQGVPIKNLVVEQIRKSLSTQNKLDQNRWLWGGLKWNL